jgi:hypothetical protein
MTRTFPQTLFAFLFAIFVIATPSHSFAATAGGGACPTGTNYLDLNNPQNGGGQGSITLASLGINSCYYIAANGSDSNAGNSETAPWLHAPGMPACSGTCASVNPGAGNGFIFRGGDTWHVSSGSPSTGGSWSWNQSGTSGAPVYLGVDFTWSSGSSFARPIINEDNPITTSEPSGCPHPDDGTNRIDLSGASWVILDGFEEQGDCTSGGSSGNIVNLGAGTHNIAERLYIHGWSVASSAGDDNHVALGNGNGNPSDNTNRLIFNVIDGSDSTWGDKCTNAACIQQIGGNSNGYATMWAVNTCWDVEYNVIRHTSQGMECGDASIVHDNLLEYLFNPAFGGRHGNVFEVTLTGNGMLCNNFVAYNNITRNTVEGVNWWISCPNHYIFNNAWLNSGHFSPDPNGLMISSAGTSGQVVKAFVYNNTFQANAAQAPGGGGSGGQWNSGSSISFQNNHIMDFTSIGNFFNCGSGNPCSTRDGGGEVWQTTSAANSQGYVIGNDYAPTTGTDATVGAGNDITSWCSTIPNGAAVTACESGSTGGVTEQSGWGGQVASYPAIQPVQRASAWDAGAYEFGLSSNGAPTPPTGLSAVVQ